MPSAPATDETLTIAPAASRRCGAAARIIWKAPSAFTPTMRWKVSASIASQLAAPANDDMPALLTSASMRPQRETAACTSARQSASSATSARQTIASAPAWRHSAAVASASASLRL